MDSRRNYAKAAREEPMESWQVHGHRPKAPLISFTEEDEASIHYPHCDALVVHAVVARNELGRMLVNERSAINFLLSSVFDQMDVDHELTTVLSHDEGLSSRLTSVNPHATLGSS
ncbi:Uncharacterized protein Adt_18550 [Abeliophyllum distichum]|uniref:Uncharacterized protein n=1 Tax=Abeliophyllum distichum TaxID=126358 RepID=A0ABD1TJP4_9LAMI